MNEQHQLDLLSDIAQIQQDADFGSSFTINFLKADRYDLLMVKLIDTDAPNPPKLLLQFHDYPALTMPTLPRFQQMDVLSNRIADSTAEYLSRKALPLDLRTVIDAILDWEEQEIPHVFHPKQITAVNLPDTLYRQIITDYKQHAPNEYAYLLSGKIGEDGVANLTQYFAGEMSIATPVYCELTDQFIDRVIYDEMSKEDNLIVWGHVHPIEGASGTDVASFAELAKWDQEIADLGRIDKQSVALLVSSLSYSVRIYDVHTEELIPTRIKEQS